MSIQAHVLFLVHAAGQIQLGEESPGAGNCVCCALLFGHEDCSSHSK